MVKAVFAGKFNPLTRSLAPFAVGASKGSFVRFLAIDILANVVWTGLALGLGYAFGASYTLAAAYFGRIIIIGFVVAVLIGLAYHFASKHFHIFARYELFALIANVIALCILATMVQGVSGWHHFMEIPDVMTNIWMNKLVSLAGWLVPMAFVVDYFIAPLFLAVLSVGVSIYFLYRERWRYLIINIFSIIGGFGIADLVKVIVASPRPMDSLVPIMRNDFSFPSLHAT
ncbi:MAG: hypothetical protein KGJ35_03840, partial [Patescibacteria group bacterium]|nr:hypothetical protein [Patescibacteria group bacterium]